jgi:hypothetical protein
MSQLNINQIAVALALTLIAMADVHSQTCPTVSSDTTVTSSCNTGIRLTGNNNLTIGTPTSGQVEITYLGSFISIGVNGTGNTISNTASGEIIAGTAFGIANYGSINILTNSGIVSAGNSGTGIGNDSASTIGTLTNLGAISAGNSGKGTDNFGAIGTLTNSGTISVGNFGVGIGNGFTGTIGTLTNSGTVSAGASGIGINNDGTGTIVTLTNSGTISAGDNGIGIINEGTIDALTNSRTISVGDNGYGIANDGAIVTLTNSGTISAGMDGYGIDNVGTINTLTNSGVISVGDTGIGISNAVTGTIGTLINSGTISVEGGVGIMTDGAITTLTNSGTISTETGGYGIVTDGAITTLTNSGTITTLFGYGIYNYRTIATLTNSGTITAVDLVGIANLGTIGTLTNSGTITATSGVGIFNFLNATITTLNNSGTISGGANGGILNVGNIITLNNAQGGNGSSASTTALTYNRKLPTNYNVIINSATHYGQLAVINPASSITNFGIYDAPFITSRTYSSVLSGTTLPTGTSSGAYDNMTWALVETGVGTEIFNLTFNGVSLMGTQQSLVNTAAALQNTYALQNAILANSFSYDCPVFGEHNVCVSAGGRNTAVSNASGLNNTSALLIATYRIKPTLRIGAYADQNLSVNNAGSTVSLGNSTPLIGLFGVWNQHLDGTGTEVKVAAAYGQKNATVNRQIVGLSEAGSGSSNLNSEGAQIIAKYGFAAMPKVIVSPYIGMRHTQNKMGAYTEALSSAVTDPLSYSALKTSSTTALLGVDANYQLTPKATLFASAGVETDTNTNNGTYSVTGVDGLAPVNFNPNPVKTRPTATLGTYFDIEKNHRLGIAGVYRKEAFQGRSTTALFATYTVGL